MRKLWRHQQMARALERTRTDVAPHTSANARPSRMSSKTGLMGASSTQ
jgi:hypothetical protein